jgi:hypothetical protein
LSTHNIHSEMILDLPELHRQLAALANPNLHHDLRAMPEVERRTAMKDIEEQIEEMLAFEHMPWQSAFEKATKAVEYEYRVEGRSTQL